MTTPLSGRGDKNSHFFPHTRSCPPHEQALVLDQHSGASNEFSPSRALITSNRRRSTCSAQARPLHISQRDHREQMACRYTPASPLSPRRPPNTRQLSPQPPRGRVSHARHTSSNMPMNLPRYHPSKFHVQHDSTMPAGVQYPGISLPRAPIPTLVESPHIMRERQRELIDLAHLSSKIAASPTGIKPQAPRLDPLGSPRGPVTPLILEETVDYFLPARPSESASAASPGSRNQGSIKDGGDKVTKTSIKDILR